MRVIRIAPKISMQTPITTTGQALPYRWGRFQGWFEIVVGAFLCLMAIFVIVLILQPDNRVARGSVRGFFEGLGKPDLFQRVVSGRSEDYGYLAGFFGVTVVLAFGAGIGLLKKRTFGIIFVLLLVVRAIADASILALVFWIGSLPYYYKRRREFR